MVTMSISSNISDCSNNGSQMMVITVAATNQQFMRLHQLSVPLNRLSQAIRNIHRSGGKVVNMSAQAIRTVSTPVNQPTSSQPVAVKPDSGSRKKKK